MYSSGDDIGAVVADIGTFSTRIGFAGDDTPKAYFPSVVGTTMIGSTKEYHFDLTKYRENMCVDSTMKDGLVSDWDKLEKIWEHALSVFLKVDLKEAPVLLAEKSYNPTNLRRKMTEIMFEKFNVPALFMSKDSVLSCFACGRTSGIVVDAGASGTVISPVCDGWIDPKGINRSFVGGRVLDAHCVHLLTQHQAVSGSIIPLFRLRKTIAADGISVIAHLRELINVHPTYDALMTLEVGRDAKESVCRAADMAVSEAELKFSSVPTSLYELPDGTVLDLGIERFRVPEVLFDNSVLEPDYPHLVALGLGIAGVGLGNALLPSGAPNPSRDNIPQLVVDSTLRCDAEMQSTLLSNVVLSGGGTCYDGITDRMKLEVEKIVQQVSPGWRVKTMASGVSERALCSWIGGSILASLGSFHEMWVTQQEYSEFGSAVVDRKCA